MRIVTVAFESLSPYSHRKPARPEHLPGELEDDYERRTWRDHIHSTQDGFVFIPGDAFAKSVQEGAKYLNIKIPGEQNRTWTKHFEAGVMVTSPLILDISANDAPGVWVYVPSNGQRGGGKRVWRCFMTLPSWAGTVRYHVLDPKITPDIFERVLACAGTLVGIGLYRPANRGQYGRYNAVDLTWETIEV